MAFTAVFPLNKWRRPARRGGFISWKVGGGPCALICLPEIGFQGGRPFARIGVGLAWDTPGILLALIGHENSGGVSVTFVSG